MLIDSWSIARFSIFIPCSNLCAKIMSYPMILSTALYLDRLSSPTATCNAATGFDSIIVRSASSIVSTPPPNIECKLDVRAIWDILMRLRRVARDDIICILIFSGSSVMTVLMFGS